MPVNDKSFVKILENVTEAGEGYPVEIHRSPGTGRLALVATNEGGNNSTYVDLEELWIALINEPLMMGLRPRATKPVPGSFSAHMEKILEDYAKYVYAA